MDPAVLLDRDREWVRDEGLALLRGAHDTMARVLLAQVALIGAKLVRSTDGAGLALVVVAVSGLSLLGSFYSFEQLRHSRFLHVYLLEGGAGSRFVRDMHRLRELAPGERRGVKWRGWEERACLVGYITGPTILGAFLVTPPGRPLSSPWSAVVLMAACVIVSWLCVKCLRAFRHDKDTWKWFFDKEGHPGQPSKLSGTV